MGSEHSSQLQQKQPQRPPPVQRGYTIATPGPGPARVVDPNTSGNNSPGASVCSDSELPYISYTVDRPIGDSPKVVKTAAPRDGKRSTVLQKRQLSLQARKAKKAHDIVVVKEAKSTPNVHADEDIRRLQDIPTFLPIMRGTLGLPNMRDPEVLEGLDYRPWVRLTSRYQAHLAACAQPLATDQLNLANKVKETDGEIARLHAQMVERQRWNARSAERLARAREVARQAGRARALLGRVARDAADLNMELPPADRLPELALDETR